jgi:hypothetical protein
MKQTWQKPTLQIVKIAQDVVTASTVSDTYSWIWSDSNLIEEVEY